MLSGQLDGGLSELLSQSADRFRYDGIGQCGGADDAKQILFGACDARYQSLQVAQIIEYARDLLGQEAALGGEMPSSLGAHEQRKAKTALGLLQQLGGGGLRNVQKRRGVCQGPRLQDGLEHLDIPKMDYPQGRGLEI
jgi:hypothetical protein